MLTPGHEIAAGLGWAKRVSSVPRRSAYDFIYASENHEFSNPTDGVTLPRRTRQMIEKKKWRSYTLAERKQILNAARNAGEVVCWCQWLA